MAHKKSHWFYLAAGLLFLMACQLSGLTAPEPQITEVPLVAPETPTPTPPVPTDTPVPTETAAPKPTTLPTLTETAVLGDEIRNVEGGYAVQVPAGWEVIQEAGQILLASPDANTYVGPRLGMLGERLEEPLTLDALLDQTLQEIFGSLSTEGFEVGEPFDLMFGGVPALGIEIIGPFGRADDGDVIAHIVVALSGENQSFMLAGFATTDRWRDEVSHLFDEVVRTVTFFEIENK